MAAHDQLDRLRKAAEIGIRPEDARELRDIEKRIKLLEDYEGLAKRPAIAGLLDWARRDIASTNERLSTDRELMRDGREAERLAMLERKDVLSYLLVLFNPREELDSIEKELSARAYTFEEYNGAQPSTPQLDG
ncbi:MAG: hypothetical protein KGI03_00890 [Patescibacteria group bacterium]|nr:hypothetical protein [Patescibacteria group bacterium]